MKDYYEYLAKGFQLIHPVMTKYIGKIMKYEYQGYWWNKIYDEILSDQQRDLPYTGNDDYLLSQLDVANCVRIFTRQWRDVFESYLPKNLRTYFNELMGIRHSYAHAGSNTIDIHMAERSLDTMYLICKELDGEEAEKIHDLYQEVREQSIGTVDLTEYSGLAQPESESVRGALKEGSLLNIEDTDLVQKTTQTRKIVYNGKTVVYPVYKVRLDKLYYNDQNDRISTWISQYEAENDKDSLSNLSRDMYNRIIENFIVESNPEAIRTTQTNIANFGQMLPGVTLADGRIVDGNRRFTCLRRIQRDNTEPVYFETVIMDMDINDDSKAIKRLELAIQHGEEKRVDYDQIDFALGTYRDIVERKLLTVEEYAESTNEPLSAVRGRIEIAQNIAEFLDYAGLPGQFFAAREYKVYDLFKDLIDYYRKLDDKEKETLKKITYSNIIMNAIPDHRKYIRDIKGLIRTDSYKDYFEEQSKIADEVRKKLDSETIHTRDDLNAFADQNSQLTCEMQDSKEHAMIRYRSKQIKTAPSEKVSRAMTTLEDIDPRLFDRLDEEEKENLRAELDSLAKMISRFRRKLSK